MSITIDNPEAEALLADLAADAVSRYGEGRHPAGLNFGDCLAYASARARNAPLLSKGYDVVRTDVADALV